MFRAMNRLDPRLQAFLSRCDAFAGRRGIQRATLSTKLFDDGKRLREIASGVSDVGIARLARAEAKLSELEGSSPSQRARARA